MTTIILNRHAVVLSAVREAWLSTTDIVEALRVAGYLWSPATVRSTLHHLADSGKIERRPRPGSGYRWRTAPALEVPAPAAHDTLQQRLDEAAERFQQAYDALSSIAAAPPPQIDPEVNIVIGPEDDLPDLLHADDRITTRIVYRAGHDALKAMLGVLDGWIEGAIENNEASGRSNDGPDGPEWFHADDIRHMVNDAARLVGTREPYVKPKP